ncbi:hypothetical protein SAMN04488028_101518 [Reichenbachiella agariperforans]|uniref:Uncharacterized protein n=1 Tax=Reichenbachiella agariperforans TaxID=156994 RepID=A0A1M6KBZ2_REIAG|nr:hypothetical protein [Reichenbachiella agariperforans]SHJ56424.1 hypothetical protein SAMN04488028_101518 [Reichenbachiella agariperforans]
MKINHILLSLESKINRTKPGSEYVVRSFSFTLEKIRKGEVSVVFDENLNYGISGCASADILEGGEINFSFGRFLIDAYDPFPLLVEGIIIHEFQHVYDFINKPELIQISRGNPIEELYFEVDAISLEGIFFKSYRTESDTMSSIERFFMNDARNRFWGVTAVFEKVDLRLLHRIDNIEKELKTSDEAIQRFEEIGIEVLNEIEFDDNDWMNYCDLVTLRTYTYFSRQVLHDILFTLEGGGLTDEELKLSRYSTINRLITKMLEVQTQHHNFVNEFRGELIENYNNEVLAAIK